MRTKHYIMTLCLLLVAMTTAMAQAVTTAQQKNTLTIPDVTMGQGSSISLPIQVANTTDIVAAQFTIMVPDGLSLAPGTAKLTERADGHTVTMRSMGDKKYMAMIHSAQNKPIKLRSGALLTVTIIASSSAEEGKEYPLALSDVVLASAKGDNVLTSYQAGKVTIAKSPDLEVSHVTTSVTSIVPKGNVTVSWQVKNVGGLAANGGWKENIYLTSADGSYDKLIGSVEYDNTLAADAAVSRSLELTMPSELGISDNGKIKVVVKPRSDTGEPSWLQKNNTGVTAQTVPVEKRLYLTPDLANIDEATAKNVRFYLSRSGSTSAEETFMLTATADSRLALPSSVTIPSGQAGVYFYAQIAANGRLDDIASLAMNLEGNGYTAVQGTVNIEDDTYPSLTISSKQIDVTEGGKIAFTIKTERVSSQDIPVSLACDLPTRFRIPADIVIPAGKESVDVEVEAIDDDTPDIEKVVTMTASAVGYNAGTMLTTLVDNDIPSLQLSLTPNAVSEGAGPLAVTAKLKRTDNINKTVTIKLTDDSNGNIHYARQSIEMASGVEEMDINLGPIDNALVDGERTYNITAAVFIASCSCNATVGTSGGSVTVPLTVYDNDGPSLTLTASASTLKEGAETTMTIARNTDTKDALTVSLSSDQDAVLEYPASVTIPVGKTSVDFTVKSKKYETSGDDLIAILTAQANGYSKGTFWISISDQNLPDAQITSLTLTTTKVEAGGDAVVKLNLSNTGNATLPEQTPIYFYLSNSSKSVATAYLQEDLAAGESTEIIRTLTMPKAVGSYKLYAVVNEEKIVKELLYTNNTSASIDLATESPFGYTVAVGKAQYKQGEAVSINGTVSGQDIANKAVEIYVVNEGYRHAIEATTDAKGSFEATYSPYNGQAGHFVVGVCYPGENATAEMASFDVYGLKRADNKAITCEANLGEKYTGSISIVNPTSLNLSVMKVSVVSSPADCEVTVNAPTSLAGKATSDISFEIMPNAESEGNDWEKIELNVETKEGATLPLTLYYYCRTTNGKLKASVASINTTMVKGASRDYPITLMNVGNGSTGKITLSLPSWMATVTPSEMPSLDKDATSEMILRLTPTDDMLLNVPVSGAIGINCANGEGLSLPFYIEPVSETTGTLTIDACDENTYYTKEAPHLAGATVTVKHPTTGAVVASGKTDKDGLYSVTLSEGYYAVTVTAEKHNTYSNNLLVDPGKDNKKVVNLSYEAIKIDWNVTETEVEDNYEIKTDVKYETSVPVPVVVLSTPNSIPAKDLNDGESLIFYASLTNKGLITAQDVELLLPTDLKSLKFEALDSSLPMDIAPNQSVFVPVKVTKVVQASQAKGMHKDSNIDDDPCADQVGTLYFWDCGNDRKWHRYDVALQLGSCDSKDPFGNGGSDSYGSGTNLGGGVGRGTGPGYGPVKGNIGGGYIGSTTNSTPLSPTEDKGCEPCQNGVLIAGAKCIGYFLGEAVETLKDLLDLADFDNDKDDDDLIGLIGQCKDYSDILLEIAESFDGCVNGKDKVDKVLDCYNTASKAVDAAFDDLVEKAFGPYIPPQVLKKYKSIGKKFLKYKKWIDAAAECAGDLYHACDHIKDKDEDNDQAQSSEAKGIRKRQTSESLTSKALEGMGQYANYLNGFSCLNNILFGSEPVWNEMSLEEMAILLNLDYGNLTYEEALQYKPQDLPASLFERFYNRQTSWKRGDYSNLSEEEQEKILTAKANINNAVNYFTDEGYKNPVEFLRTTLKDAWINANKSSSSVCSSITLQFTQQMTMTRQAFRGTLSIFNGSEDTSMGDIKLNLTVKDEDGNIAGSNKFQVNPEKIDGFAGNLDFNSGWTLEAQKTGTATILFIPTKNAAPTVPQRYCFGGSISYIDPFTGLEVTRELSPITLTVKPSPNLNLTYFMQRDIKGDDPLTADVVEPSEEAEFSVLINNVGYGDATDIRMVTNQPEIVANEKGLAVKFNLVSSQLNGEEKSLALGGSVATEFGTIPAQKTAYAQWWMTSSLLGHFTSYDIAANHVSSYGNPDLSLLKEVTIHELIRSIDIPKDDEKMVGFLTNDIVDANDTPDMIYLSNGDIEDVSKVKEAKLIKVSETEYQLTITPSKKGWNYGNLNDPTYGISALKEIARQNSSGEIGQRSIWQTDCTLRDGKDPLYENLLHFVDNFEDGTSKTYTLTFEPTPELVLEVAAIEGTPVEENEIAEQPIKQLKVVFNKPIDAQTFATDDLTFVVQGKQQDASLIGISTDDNKTFTLDFSAWTDNAVNGYYSLTVQTAEISDWEGYHGKTGKNASWTMFKDGLVRLLTSTYPEKSGDITRVIENASQTKEKMASSKIDSKKSEMSGADSNMVEYGTAFKLQAKPREGYEFVSWSLDGEVVSTEPTLEQVSLRDYEYVANFKKTPCSITIDTECEGGRIEGCNTGIYDQDTEMELTAVADDDYIFDTWVVNGKAMEGTENVKFTVSGETSISAKFTREVFLQKMVIYKGWNWVSSYLKEMVSTDNFLLNSATIVGTSDDTSVLLPVTTYKVKAVSSFVDYSRGHLYDAKADAPSLKVGWNWLGYPYSYSSTITDAISNAEEGDVLVGQSGFAEYSNNSWEGTLLTLLPNHGYLYKSASEKALCFSLDKVSTTQGETAGNDNESTETIPRQYQEVMSIIALIKENGENVAKSSLQVTAMVGDELRGVGKIVNGKYYLTVYGNTAEEVKFFVENNETGDKTEITETMDFKEDLVGDRKTPYVIDLDLATNINAIFAEGKSVQIYNLQGILVDGFATRKSIEKLPQGVYIVNGKKLVKR